MIVAINRMNNAIFTRVRKVREGIVALLTHNHALFIAILSRCICLPLVLSRFDNGYFFVRFIHYRPIRDRFGMILLLLCLNFLLLQFLDVDPCLPSLGYWFLYIAGSERLLILLVIR